MSPIELIKEGIDNKNWQKICTAYKILTGETISQNHSNSDKEDKDKHSFREKIIPTEPVGQNKIVLITDDIPKPNTKRKKRKTREAFKMNESKCSECGKIFQTSLKVTSKEFGQQCADCVRDKIHKS